MVDGSAHLDSPAVIAGFRAHLITFLEKARRAADGAAADARRVRDWLGGEQQTTWRSQLLRLERQREQALVDDHRARHGGPRAGAFDAAKHLRRIESEMEEVRGKLAAVHRWQQRLEQETTPLVKQCTAMVALTEQLGPQALGRLDHLLDHLDDYLRPRPATPAQGSDIAQDEPCPD